VAGLFGTPNDPAAFAMMIATNQGHAGVPA
jgi:hypothetical protein